MGMLAEQARLLLHRASPAAGAGREIDGYDESRVRELALARPWTSAA